MLQFLREGYVIDRKELNDILDDYEYQTSHYISREFYTHWDNRLKHQTNCISSSLNFSVSYFSGESLHKKEPLKGLKGTDSDTSDSNTEN